MKSKYGFTLLTALAFAAWVATAPAQTGVQSTGGQSGASNDLRPQDTQNPGLSGNQFSPFGGSAGGPFPPTAQPGAEEMGLAQRANYLIRELEGASTDLQRSDIKAKLSEILTKQFDARQKRHRLEIEALEAKVTKLKELVKKRQESREDIVTRRLEQLMRDTQGLGW